MNAAHRHIYLLHSRLKIIDLDDRANQPFQVGRKWMVYNGELYNYRELRAKLLSQGQRCQTESDTEVLLRTVDHGGWEGLDACEGMWAFAVYDEADGTLTLCRDRFAEKPLYVYRDASGFYFGSEVKCITALLGRSLPLDLNHLYRYLVNGYRALYKRGGTFFQGVRELPAATRLRVDAAGDHEEAHTYWAVRCCPDEGMTYEEAVAGARDRLLQAVALRLRADVPLAFCMSGGMDSTSLVSIAKRVFDYDVHAFTILNTDERYDERELVECAVRDLGIRHTWVPLEATGFLERLRTLVRQHDAPVYTISYYAHWVLMQRIAEEGYRVALSGTGADELYTGYYDHHLAYLYEIRDDADAFRAALRAWEQHTRPLVRNPLLANARLWLDDPNVRDHLFFRSDEFARYLTNNWHEPFVEEGFANTLLRNRMLNELLREVVPVILHEDDLNAMSCSIENRSPFLDRALCEFCYRIPTRYLIRDGYTKAVLRDSMRNIVPDAILWNRRKVGFNVPMSAVLDVHDPAVRGDLLDGSRIFEHVRRDKIETLLDRAGLPNSESKFLFAFLNSKIFLEEFEREPQPAAA